MIRSGPSITPSARLSVAVDVVREGGAEVLGVRSWLPGTRWNGTVSGASSSREVLGTPPGGPR